jgi:hypothetical protein
MSAANSSGDMSSQTALQVSVKPESIQHGRPSIGRVFKRLKTAIQRISGLSKGTGPVRVQSTTQGTMTPIETLEVDDTLDQPCAELRRSA